MIVNVFIFIANSWGSKEGGINSFNFDLSLACARIARLEREMKICCVIPDLTNKVCSEIKRDNALPITLQGSDFQSSSAADIIIDHLKSSSELRRRFPEKCNTFWIGHDVYTGELAEQCAIACNGWSIIFHHMDYASYYLYKNQNIEEYSKKVDKQKAILCAADLVCAVGPKLQNSAQDIVRRNQNLKVLEVYPGIADLDSIETVSKRFNPIVFGRVEKDNQRVKQISLAINAYAKAVANDKNYDIIGTDSRLYVIGYKDDDRECFEEEVQRLNENASEVAKKLCNIVPLPYISDRKQLGEKIAEASVAMMLSFHEGFGLVGYEAIAAGVPVVISKNTGLYVFLHKNRLSHLVYGVEIEGACTPDGFSENDLSIVSNALIEIRRNEDEHKRRALELRDILRSQKEKYSWDAVAHNFIDRVFEVFTNDLKGVQEIFFQPKDMKQFIIPEHQKGQVACYIKAVGRKHVFKVKGYGALGLLIEDLRELYADESYKVLVYNILSKPENKSDFYDYFIADCQDYFGSENSANSFTWFAENEFADKLHNTILILNHFPEDPSAYFDTLFSILEKSRKNFLIFTVLDQDSSSPVQVTSFAEKNFVEGDTSTTIVTSQPDLTKSQKTLIKILSFFRRVYTKKIINYICNSIDLYLEKVNKDPIFTNALEIEDKLYELGLIEEFSEYSCQNAKLLYEIASGIEIDNAIYALGIFELGCYYARCYRFNRNQDPQLNWGAFSCQCFETAVKTNSNMAKEIKIEYESILSEMRFKFMRTAQYERYIRLLENYIDVFKEPDNLWLWYNLLHCQSIYQPKQETLKITEELLNTKISKLNFEEPKNAELYIQFIRLCAELENDLDCDQVTNNLLEREKIIPRRQIGNNIWSQYTTTLITVAIDQNDFELAASNIKKLKNIQDNPYAWINACALEITLEMIQFEKRITTALSGNLSDIERAYEMACNTINDMRSRSWISGLLGEYLLLIGKQDGEKKIKCSLIARKRSGEKSKSYRNWLIRIYSLKISSEMRQLILQEFERTGIIID